MFTTIFYVFCILWSPLGFDVLTNTTYILHKIIQIGFNQQKYGVRVYVTHMSTSCVRVRHAHEYVTRTSTSCTRVRHAHEYVTRTSTSRARARHAHEYVTRTSTLCPKPTRFCRHTYVCTSWVSIACGCK